MDYSFDDEGMPVLKNSSISRNKKSSYETEESDLTHIFDLDKEGVDVTVSPSAGTLSWSYMNPKGSHRKAKGLSSIFKRRGSSAKASNKNFIHLQDIFGVQIKRRRSAAQSEGEGACLGFVVSTFERKDPIVLRHRQIFFEHPSEGICAKFAAIITNYISEIPDRPRSVKLFLQPFAGNKQGKSLYAKKILPIFKAADCNVDCTVNCWKKNEDVKHNEFIKQDMVHLNIEDYDCIVCMGGDGTVNKTVAGLLNNVQKENDVDVKPSFTPIRPTTALGIIPTGLSNNIARSFMGTEDPVTAALHIVLGNRLRMDVCSLFSDEKLIKWAFNCHYGFGGNVLALMPRYAMMGQVRKQEAAFHKALTKSKFRSYKCDIEYIPVPASEVSPKTFNTPCKSDCHICWVEEEIGSDGVTRDLVQELNPLNCSGTSSTIIDLTDDSPWKQCKGDYMNVSVYTIAGLCDMAPQGLSKCTHLCDGFLDLVMVKEVDRKDFVRFIKRHGNSKNPFDFPFVEVHRVKEVKFRPRLPVGWSYKDYDYNEIEYEMSKEKLKSRSAEFLNEIDLHDDDGNQKMFVKSTRSHSVVATEKRFDSVQVIDDLSDDDDDDDDSDEDDDDSDEDDEIFDSENGEKASQHSSEKNNNKSHSVSKSAAPKQRLVGPQYRMTETEKESRRRKKKQRKKEEKRKNKEQMRMRSVWNVDNDLCYNRELHIRVHHGLLTVCGQGVSPEVEPDETKLTCLAIL